jgi:hypothetical protein
LKLTRDSSRVCRNCRVHDTHCWDTFRQLSAETSYKGRFIAYGLLALESGVSALREAHHPFDRILARENLRQERGEGHCQLNKNEQH